MFIDPYIKHQIMSAFKYTNFSNKEVETAIAYTKSTLMKVLN